jgi:CheY-like chemotaxis protein
VEPGPLVLVVDEKPGIRRMARRVLEADGYRVVEAASHDEAMEMLGRAELAIDLVLADLGAAGAGVDDTGRLILATQRDLDTLDGAATRDRASETWQPRLWDVDPN